MVLPPSQYISALCAVCDHVRETGEWIVIVAPGDKGFSTSLQKALVAIKTPDMELGGTTLLLPEGGRVSIVDGFHSVAGEDFLVMFLGYDDALSPRDELRLHTWRHNAKGTVTLGDRPGELRINR